MTGIKDSRFFSEQKRQRQETEQEIRDRYLLLMEDLQKTFSTPQGSRVLNWILGLCHVGASTFTGNSQTFYNCGQQDIGHTILNHIQEADPEIYSRLLKQKAAILQARTIDRFGLAKKP